MKHQQLATANGPIHYWVSRKDTPTALVFLHGLTADHHHFHQQYAAFKDHVTLFAWDAPMHGLSRPYDNFSYATAVGQLKAILDREGLQRVVLIAHSLGGYFAQLFIKRYPDQVVGFFAVDTAPFDPTYYHALDRWALNNSTRFFTWMPERLLKISIAKSNTATLASYRTMKNALTPFSKKDLIETIDTAYRQLVHEMQPIPLRIPVLLAVGEKDRTWKVTAASFAWAEREHLPLVIIPKAAHNANVDNPKYFNAVMQAFLKQLHVL